MPQARSDLRDVIIYIAQDNPDAAERIEDRIIQATRRLISHPEMGRPGRVPGTRELVVASTPYVVPYRIRGERVELLAVIHTARQWPSSFEST
ncbi:MAG TPA: type II toxin-antitoxin system RelE/ParE family toxin [Chloroflexota bacterium]|nr:type II toxin-antitoxin system RelE/ParE family toxin [Chloroflexota bacterium]